MNDLLLRMKKTFFLSLLLLLPVITTAQNIEDDLSRLDSLLRVHQNMHFYRSPTLGRADSVWHHTENLYLYFDTDSICRQFIRKGGFNAIPDELNYLYYSVFTELSPERRAQNIDKMESIAQEFHSEALMREVELQRVFSLPSDSEEQYEYKLNRCIELEDQAAKNRDLVMQLRVEREILVFSYYSNHIFEAFKQAVDILSFLDHITDEQYIERTNLYFSIGEIFYLYGYNEQAIPILQKALKKANFFFERCNLRARNTLGIYFRNNGDLDLSDQYFRSMLESPDQVQYRGEYDAIAICNLGKNYLFRKNYPKAETLMQKGLTVMAQFDPSFALGVYINLGNCYLADGRIAQATAMADSTQKYIRIYPSWGTPNTEYYPFMSKYYAAIGNENASLAYMDSTIHQQNEYREKYNASQIFQIEKKLFEAGKKLDEEKFNAEQLKKKLFRTLFISLLSLVGATVIFYLFYDRMHKRKNRLLYKHIVNESQLQTELVETRQQLSTIRQHEKPLTARKKNGHNLLQRLKELMETERLYTDPALTRKDLAKRLYTNENYLVTAIHDGYNGRTFTEYLNFLRLEYARYMLVHQTELTIKDISEHAGFASYKYFHKLFHDEFGISPSEFRKESQRVSS